MAILADPSAETDCELDPSGFVDLACGTEAARAAEELGNRRSLESVGALAATVQNDTAHPDAREAAWQALEQIGGSAVVAALVDIIANAENRMAADRAADMLGRLGGVEHNELLARYGPGDGYFAALVAINRADASPLLGFLDSAHTVWVYGPLIAIGEDGTEQALIGALTTWGIAEMAEAFLNSGNATLAAAAEEWAAAHGYTITRLPVGTSVTWDSA